MNVKLACQLVLKPIKETTLGTRVQIIHPLYIYKYYIYSIVNKYIVVLESQLQKQFRTDRDSSVSGGSSTYSCSDSVAVQHIVVQIQQQYNIKLFRFSSSATYSCSVSVAVTHIVVQFQQQFRFITYSCSVLDAFQGIHAQFRQQLRTQLFSFSTSSERSISVLVALQLQTIQLFSFSRSSTYSCSVSVAVQNKVVQFQKQFNIQLFSFSSS